MRALTLLFLSSLSACLPTVNPVHADADVRTDYQLGEVPRNGVTWVEIPIYNSTDQPLTLFDVNASCGCLATAFRPQELAPGETYELEVTVSVRDKQGAFSERVRVFSTSEELNERVYQLIGEVVEGPGAIDELELGTLRPEVGSGTSIVIGDVLGRWLDEDQIDQVQVIPTNHTLPLDFAVAQIDGTQDLEVFGSLRPSAQRGFFSTKIRIYLPSSSSNDAEGLYFETRITGAGVPTVWADPPGIDQDMVRVGKASIQIGWLPDVDVSFATETKYRDEYSFAIDQDGTSTWLKIEFPNRELNRQTEALELPFVVDGSEYSLTIPIVWAGEAE